METVASSTFVIGADMAVLDEIRSGAVNLAIWERENRWSQAARELLLAPSPIRMDLKAPNVPLVADVLSAHGVGEVMPLAEDVVFLASIFGRTAGTRHPRVRLERVDDDGCALFHADSLRIRLLCTYAGAGTEWLEEDNVNRDQLGLRGRTLDQANAEIVRDGAAIRRISTGAVAIFTGRAHEAVPPLVHRSAPVSAARESRIRLCIDLPGDCGC